LTAGNTTKENEDTNKLYTNQMPSPNRIQVYLPPEIFKQLKDMAEKQNRSASNLAASFIIRTVETESTSYPETINFVEALANDTKPSDANLILTANELNLEPELLFKLRDRLFKKGKQSADI
jgi:hypothetical protein